MHYPKQEDYLYKEDRRNKKSRISIHRGKPIQSRTQERWTDIGGKTTLGDSTSLASGHIQPHMAHSV